MAFVLEYFQHKQACKSKQSARAELISSLPSTYHLPFTPQNRSILSKPIEHLVQDVHKHITSPIQILHSYSKAAVSAHSRTNCLTELLLPDPAESSARNVDPSLPLAGIPVSLKDTFITADRDASAGYSRYTSAPHPQDGALARYLLSLGCVPYVKTALPITLLSFESSSALWGRSTNPYSKWHSPGGSTGGEAALLSLGGSRIGVGSDVAGSVRLPAHNSGIYALRCSVGRWPKMGATTSMPGQEGVPAVCSPMARGLPDLVYFTKCVLSGKPEQWDHTVIPLPWKKERYAAIKEKQTLRIGVLDSDGVVRPSPACARALRTTCSALEAQGHTIVPLTPPVAPLEALKLGAALLLGDGGTTMMQPFRTGEWNDTGAAQMVFWAGLPRVFRWLWRAWTRYVRRDAIWADVLASVETDRRVSGQMKLVAKRESMREAWHKWWWGGSDVGVDLLICPVNGTPALPHGAMKDAAASCGYTFLWNVLDWSAGVVPVLRVEKGRDGLAEDWRAENGVEAGAYKYYDATAMEGLPVGVQIVGPRLSEEAVLAGMERVRGALDEAGVEWEALDVTKMEGKDDDT